MPFIPNTSYGITYAMACVLVFVIAQSCRSPQAKVVSFIMMAHWILLRTICVIDHSNFALWVGHDILLVSAMSFYGWRENSKLALASASIFFIVMLFDQWAWMTNGAFDAASAVAEAGGYIVFAMIAGASIGNSGFGKMGDFTRGIRHLVGFGFVESRRSISGRSAVSHKSMASNSHHQEEDRTVA